MAKKFLTVMLMVCLCGVMILTSCSTKAQEEKQKQRQEILDSVSTDFKSGAHIKYKDLEAYGQISKEEENCFDIYFTSPEDLSDVTISLIEGKIRVKYKDLAVTLDNEKAFGRTVTAIAEKTINSELAEKGVEIHFVNSSIVLSGEVRGAQFNLVIDTVTGNFLNLTVPEDDFYLEFNNFTIKE